MYAELAKRIIKFTLRSIRPKAFECKAYVQRLLSGRGQKTFAVSWFLQYPGVSLFARKQSEE